MFRSLVHRLTGHPADGVEFCDECGQACTGACRSDTILETARTTALRSLSGLR